MLFWFIQFLGRDKDDGVRRSAVSGKKVGFPCLVLWAILKMEQSSYIFVYLRFFFFFVDSVETWQDKGGQGGRKQKKWIAEIFECQLWLISCSSISHPESQDFHVFLLYDFCYHIFLFMKLIPNILAAFDSLLIKFWVLLIQGK